MDTDIIDLAGEIEKFIYRRAIKRAAEGKNPLPLLLLNPYQDMAEAVSYALNQLSSIFYEDKSKEWLEDKAKKVVELFQTY